MSMRKLSYGDYKDFTIADVLDILIEQNNMEYENGDAKDKPKIAKTKDEVLKAMGF